MAKAKVLAKEDLELWETLIRRAKAREDLPDVLANAFEKQKQFILDQAKLKALFCTRRSAKSYTAGLYLIYEALKNPGCNCLFTGLTRLSAKGIIWKDILFDINNKLNLGANFNQTDLTMTLPNGSEIWVTGIDADEQEMRKILGRKFRLACIDEASMYTIDLRGFIYGVLAPAMVDPNMGGDRGTICLMGTASDFPKGLFFDITNRKEAGWKLYQWSAYDNPYVAKQWHESILEIAKDRPQYMDTPQFKQWYLNEWVIDESKLVYKFDPQKNLIKELPKLSTEDWTYVLGIDTGWEDANAFVLTGYHIHDPHLYVINTFHKNKLTFDQVAEVIERFKVSQDYPVHKFIIDGANKQGVESMRARTSIPLENAEKQDKTTFIEIMNGDLVQSKIKILDIPQNRPLWQEMMSLVWLTDGDTIKLPKKEHPNLPNHLCDAFLYAWRCGYHYSSVKPERKIITGSREWYEKQSQDIWEKEKEALMQDSSWAEEPELGLGFESLFGKR